jgi:hypothetical protein
MASLANISFYKGEDVVLTVAMTPATSISGWSLQFTLRKQSSGGSNAPGYHR